ncbi:MAG: hypothetical protein GEV10_13775 [Streptosporangiales bacterium]|nr:hypothetical protein [Streptosporangiales bacterium]
MSSLEKVRANRARVYEQARALAQAAADENRAFSDSEQRAFEGLNSQIDQFDERIAEQEALQARLAHSDARFEALGGSHRASAHPLAFRPEALDNLQAALDTRSAGRFEAADVEQRAALVTTTYGAPRVWGSNVLSGPRMLHVVAGVPRQEADAALAQHPNLTLPTAQASVGENVSLAEFAASTAGSVTLARFGRWTDMSRESRIGTDAGAIVGMHAIGVAKDLDLVLVNAVEAAAGAAVAFSADVPAAVRSAMARVIDATAATDSTDLVVLVHPDNAALLQDVSPIGGATIAESFQRFSGALIYPSSAVNTGFVTVANLRAGARFFDAQGFLTETEVSVKTGTVTVASSVIGGYGVGLTGGFASTVDVVTP